MLVPVSLHHNGPQKRLALSLQVIMMALRGPLPSRNCIDGKAYKHYTLVGSNLYCIDFV